MRPVDYQPGELREDAPKSCQYFVTFKDGKFVVMNKGKPIIGKLVGDPALIAQYERGASDAASATTTTTAGG